MNKSTHLSRIFILFTKNSILKSRCQADLCFYSAVSFALKDIMRGVAMPSNRTMYAPLSTSIFSIAPSPKTSWRTRLPMASLLL